MARISRIPPAAARVFCDQCADIVLFEEDREASLLTERFGLNLHE